MVTLTAAPETELTVADLLDRFGPIALRRIRREPEPGTATEQDVIDIHDREKRLFELVDGILVEKTMGVQDSFVAVWIAGFIGQFARQHDLGIVLGSDGMARLAPGLVRIPDVSFIGWDRLPGKKVPDIPMLTTGPNLAVEVLSPSNTHKEMQQKLAEYFDSSVQLVWYVDPRSRTVRVFTSPENVVTLNESDMLDGGSLLPGFQLPVAKLFEQVERAG
ncbi:MAG: Uma2 family endonuclease [Planctomycetaceae bacterium]|nr:Uma2 family endonuclease [Planctomycetaceae bacterium]